MHRRRVRLEPRGFALAGDRFGEAFGMLIREPQVRVGLERARVDVDRAFAVGFGFGQPTGASHDAGQVDAGIEQTRVVAERFLVASRGVVGGALLEADVGQHVVRFGQRGLEADCLLKLQRGRVVLAGGIGHAAELQMDVGKLGMLPRDRLELLALRRGALVLRAGCRD